MGLTIYVRYRQVLELFGYHPDLGEQLLKLNKISVWFGIASCVGISFVANFQETNVRIVHFFGAFCCFGFGTLYFWMQVNMVNGVLSKWFCKFMMITLISVPNIVHITTNSRNEVEGAFKDSHVCCMYGFVCSLSCYWSNISYSLQRNRSSQMVGFPYLKL